MKNYDQLTRLGRIRRCRKIVLKSLEYYDIKIKSLMFLDEASNIFFKLVDENNDKFAVKISQDLNSNMDDSDVEMFFLSILNRKSEHNVPKPVANKHHDFITYMETPFDHNKRRVVVYEWMDGKSFYKFETSERFVTIGKLLAKLHQEMKKADFPETLNPKKMDRVLYFPTDDIFYKMEANKHKVTDEIIHLFDCAIPYLDEKMKQLYDKKTFLIHGDLNPWNIRINHQEIHFIDFEDACLGHEIHDIAILLYFYQYDDNYEVYKAALLRGYKSVRNIEINEDDLLTLMMARRVNLMNYFIAVRTELKDYLDINMKRLLEYFKTVKDFKLK